MLKVGCYLTSYWSSFPISPTLPSAKQQVLMPVFPWVYLGLRCRHSAMPRWHKERSGYGYSEYADEKCWHRSYNTWMKESRGGLSDSHPRVWEAYIWGSREREFRWCKFLLKAVAQNLGCWEKIFYNYKCKNGYHIWVPAPCQMLWEEFPVHWLF